jgi:hypothetical protein
MVEAITTTSPVVNVFPYLSPRAPVVFGDWWLGPIAQYEGPWLTPDLALATKRFLEGFVDVEGEQIVNPAVLASTTAGVTGEPLTLAEQQAIELTIGFAAIDQNPFRTPENQHFGWAVATADNADLWMQPLASDGFVTLGRGLRNTTRAGGLNIYDDAFRIPPPLELRELATGIAFDEVLVRAAYQVLATPTAEQERFHDELRVAIRWLLKSWQNSPSISWEDRIVFLKTASEGIAQTHKTVDAVGALLRRYETATGQDPPGFGLGNLLWSPDEARATRIWGNPPRSQDITLFEHWYWALADARNAILHNGSASTLTYDYPGSSYSGALLETGDRVMRELVKLTLGLCGYPEVWRNLLDRAVIVATDAAQTGED